MVLFQAPAIIITARAAATQAAARTITATAAATQAAARTITATVAAIQAAARIIPVAGHTATVLTTVMQSATATALTPVQTAEPFRPAIRIAAAIKYDTMAAGKSRRFFKSV